MDRAFVDTLSVQWGELGFAGVMQIPRVFLMNEGSDPQIKKRKCQAKGPDFEMKRDGIGSQMLKVAFVMGGWDRFSPGCKITLFLTPVIAVIILFSLEGILYSWLVAFVLLLLTRPNGEWWVTRFLPLAGSIGFFGVWLPWTVNGPGIWPDLWYSPSWVGVGRAAVLWLKGTTVAMGFLGLGRVSTANEILATFQVLKIPSVPLCVAWITIQQTNRLLADWRRVLQAHRARATPVRGALGQTQFMAGVWAQMLVRSQKRTEDLVCGLQARGFSRKFHFLPKAPFSFFMWVFPVFLAILFFGLWAVEQGWK